MSRIATKICGLSTPETIGTAVRAGADYLGFVHFPRSPRHVEVEQMRALAGPVPLHVGRVAVLVDPDDEMIAALMGTGVLTAVQLHGKEPVERVAAVRARFALPVWKAVPVKSRADIDAANRYEGAADLILFDAKTPDNAALPGGMGLRFDWTLLRGAKPALPWALSGGLDALNVREAIDQTGASLVDVSSGVESAPGVKDMDKITAFCDAVAAC